MERCIYKHDTTLQLTFELPGTTAVRKSDVGIEPVNTANGNGVQMGTVSTGSVVSQISLQLLHWVLFAHEKQRTFLFSPSIIT